MEEQQSIDLTNYKIKKFNNNVDYCVGTGRMGLALTQEYLQELKYVQDNLGFRHIRGHGLFAEDIGIYQQYTDANGDIKVEYNFLYLDRIMDSYKKLHIKPFLELGFMPDQLASGPETVFHWRGNITYPNDETKWTELVIATLSHLLDRYGDDVLDWPIEVWNEPNQDGFWLDTDADKYFKLFKITFLAIKKFNSKFKVGGPAISGNNCDWWMRAFLDFCQSNKLTPDFITRHFYVGKSSTKKTLGHYSYFDLYEPDIVLEELERSRAIIDAFDEYKGLPMHVTEFNTSYRQDSPIHDTVFNAAYCAYLLSRLGETSNSYSYWTFGDVFEETGIPFTQFYGGFGLVSAHNIPKPSYWTFKFFKKLYKNLVFKSDHVLITQNDNASEICGIIWSYDSDNSLNYNITLPESFVSSNEVQVISYKIDNEHGNPLKNWMDTGQTKSLTEDEINFLKKCATPEIKTKSTKNGNVRVELDGIGIKFFQINVANTVGDRGYINIS